MKRFHLWMSLARLPLPEASSESARMRPSAEASGIVRNARRKLLPWKRVIFSFMLFAQQWPFQLSVFCPLPFKFPGSRRTDLTRITSGEVQHMEEEAKLTCQAELLLAKVVLD